eukprot:386473-Prymnesium_polylepis.1
MPSLRVEKCTRAVPHPFCTPRSAQAWRCRAHTRSTRLVGHRESEPVQHARASHRPPPHALRSPVHGEQAHLLHQDPIVLAGGVRALRQPDAVQVEAVQQGPQPARRGGG